MQIFGLAGWSGSGKTTLIVQLIPALLRCGVTVSTIKHAHHDFDVDQPGKDSYRHRQSGATEVMVSSDRRWALMHELHGAPQPTIEELSRYMSPVDLMLIEGFKREPHPKLEIHRPALGQPLLAFEDDTIVAVASDAAVPGLAIPLLPLNDAEAIARFIITHCRIEVSERGAAQ
jgi:molybdopterin-guanine dinucleotide biosynthesis protein B